VITINNIVVSGEAILSAENSGKPWRSRLHARQLFVYLTSNVRRFSYVVLHFQILHFPVLIIISAAVHGQKLVGRGLAVLIYKIRVVSH